MNKMMWIGFGIMIVGALVIFSIKDDKNQEIEKKVNELNGDLKPKPQSITLIQSQLDDLKLRLASYDEEIERLKAMCDKSILTSAVEQMAKKYDYLEMKVSAQKPPAFPAKLHVVLENQIQEPDKKSQFSKIKKQLDGL